VRIRVQEKSCQRLVRLLNKRYRYNKKTFHKKQYFFSRDNLDEVIVLDLSSEESRAEFFGVTLLSEESKAVEMILVKGLENIK
jgi:hypothetical protein